MPAVGFLLEVIIARRRHKANPENQMVFSEEDEGSARPLTASAEKLNWEANEGPAVMADNQPPPSDST